ncbi:MAG: KpsF/GutQ family sugar-phosphate isomerase [Planctomycetia bacterium]|nr:KpsF/GutQ family sugar-phosphate isomerase [Planctomycetia bacterium]
MTSDAAVPLSRLTPFEQLRYAREIIQLEGQALDRLAGRLGPEFCEATELVSACQGTVVVTGVGKAGLIGTKISATLASTGTRSIFLHPVEAMHGDLGRVRAGDVVLALSQSGESEEVVRLLPSLTRLGVPIIAVTGRATNTLARAATVTLTLGPLREACPLGMAPSTSTTAMLAVGDALALVAMRLAGFGHQDFALVHPAGALGRRMARVEDQMRPLSECRVARDSQIVREVFAALGRPGRRSGAIMLVDAAGALSGIFTDSDLARLFESRRDGAVDGPIREVMTRDPCTVPAGAMLTDAVAILAERKISELPVVDARRAPVGLLDITDVLGMMPEEQGSGIGG